MSKRAEEYANELFPDRQDIPAGNDFANMERRRRFIQGYEQAEKDTIERVVKWLEENNIGYNYSESSFDCGNPAELINDLKKALEE